MLLVYNSHFRDNIFLIKDIYNLCWFLVFGLLRGTGISSPRVGAGVLFLGYQAYLGLGSGLGSSVGVPSLSLGKVYVWV